MRPLPPEATNVLDAFRAACFDYGVPALADAMGTSATMLYNKANPTDAGHPATLTDAVLVTRLTENPIIAQAFAHAAGGAFIPIPRHGRIDEQELLALVTEWMKEQGRFFVAFDEAWSDKRVSPREMKSLNSQAQKVVTACLALVARLETAGAK